MGAPKSFWVSLVILCALHLSMDFSPPLLKGTLVARNANARSLHGHLVDHLAVVESLGGLPDVLQRNAL